MTTIETGDRTRDAFPQWVVALVVAAALLSATGAFLALFRPSQLVSPHDEINGAVRIYAGYMVSRNSVIALMLLTAIALRARSMLSSLMLLTAFIQFADAVIDCVEGRWPIVPVVLVLGILFLVGAARISGNPFWKSDALT